MITRDLELTISNNKATLKEPVTIYMHDRNIMLRITINGSEFITKEAFIPSTGLIADKRIFNAHTIIKSPDGKIYKYVDETVQDNRVHVLIPKEWTDEIKEMGKYYLQIQIIGDSDSRVTLPPFFITLEKPIFPYDDGEIGEVDDSSFNTSIVGSIPGLVDASNIKTGYYDQNAWGGENTLITKEALNKVENRLGEIYSGDGFKLTEINDYTTNNKTTVGAVNELKTLLDNLRNEMNNYIVSMEPNKEVPVQTISLDDTTVTLDVGEKYQMKYSVKPANHTEKLIWSTGDSNIATVDENGLVTGISNGTTSVFCTTSKSSKYDMVEADVIPKIKQITLNDYEITLQKGETYQLECTINPFNTPQQEVTWSSSNNNIATVDQTGLVTYISSGTVHITCKSLHDEEISVQCLVNCESIELESITTVPNVVVLNLEQEQTYQLSYELTPSDIDISDVDIQWTTTKFDVATVDPNGLVRAISVGECYIYAWDVKSNKESNRIRCVVKEADSTVSITKIDIAATSSVISNMEVGSRERVYIGVEPTNYTEEYVWCSTDESVAKVDEEKYIVALSPGTCKIYAVSDSDIKSNELEITVKELISDNISVSSTELQILKGGGKSITFWLNNAPVQDQIVDIVINDDSGIIYPIDTTSFLFTADNYHLPQSVLIMTNSSAEVGATATITLSNPNYISKTINVTII